MPVVGTKAAASAQGFGEFAQASTTATYIEDVFSTWLYTGNASTQTITNGINLSAKGGLVWLKARGQIEGHALFDTARGAGKVIRSNLTNAEFNEQSSIGMAFNTNGVSWGGGNYESNTNNITYASWTFRKQPKFFDVVTYTGNNTARTIAHSLGSAPGCIIIKPINSAIQNNWVVYHQSLGNTGAIFLNLTDAASTGITGYWNSTTPTSTVFSLGTANAINQTGINYVAYLFAHNAGGFGLTGTDNVISCGSYTTDGSGNATVTLGYEPQWIITKSSSANDGFGWIMVDNMRGWAVGGNEAQLFANTSGAEAFGNFSSITPTGFTISGLNASTTYIYIAIRRGPMKTPTSGTSVFAMDTQGSTTPRPPSYKSNFPVDWAYTKDKGTVGDWYVGSRLTGPNALSFNSTTAESPTAAYKFDYQNGWLNSTAIDSNRQSWMFQRAPSFFDVVCYTATGAIPSNISHNLGAVPELLIVKKRNALDTWTVYSAATGNNKEMSLNNTGAPSTNVNVWNSTTPTASVFTVGLSGSVNGAGETYVAYLFASCPGVSKVGSYTGTGATQIISCGFAARFVLIRRISGTGDWWVWDTSRGMVAATDPRLALQSTAAETNANWVYTDASGFQIVTTDATVNASGGSYIYLAIA